MKRGIFSFAVDILTSLVRVGKTGGYIEYLSDVFTFRKTDNTTLAQLKIAEGVDPEHAVAVSQIAALTPTVEDRFAYDATVGTGGDYATHKLAYAAGARRVAQISDVTETADSNVSGSYLIEGNGYTLNSNFNFHDRGNPSKYFVARNLTIKVTTYVNSFFYTYNRLELDNCILDHSLVTGVSAWNNGGLYPTVRLNLVTFKPSAGGSVFNYSGGSIKNCTIVGIATGTDYILFKGDTFTNAYCVIDNMILYGAFKSALTGTEVFEDAGKTSFSNCRHLGTGIVSIDSPISAVLCDSITVVNSYGNVLMPAKSSILPALTTFKQEFTPTGTTQTISLGAGGFIKLNLGSATGDVTLTLNNPIEGATYAFRIVQGVTSRDIIFPAGTTTLDGGGDTVLGITSAVQLVVVFYDGSNFIITKGQEAI